MKKKLISNIIGFDDAPFASSYTGAVKVVGTVFASIRLDGVLVGEVQKDGFDSTQVLAAMISGSRFAQQTNLIMLQGIALAGFNLVDVFSLHQQLDLPILVVSRRSPNIQAIQQALLSGIPQGEEKWHIIQQLGPMEAVGKLFIQRVGLTLEQASSVIERSAVHSNIPEPLRCAHLIAGALVNGESRGDP